LELQLKKSESLNHG